MLIDRQSAYLYLTSIEREIQETVEIRDRLVEIVKLQPEIPYLKEVLEEADRKILLVQEKFDYVKGVFERDFGPYQQA